MAIPTSRTTFKDYCKRKLGYPVLEINVDDDQIDDLIDDALQIFMNDILMVLRECISNIN